MPPILSTHLIAGENAAGNTRTSAPVTAAGSRRWFSVTEELRDYLRTENNWKLTDPNNRPLATSPDGKYTLGIVGGNEETGNPDPAALPKAHRKKGKATEESVNQQPTLFQLNRPASNPLTIDDIAAPPAGGWFLLYHRAEDEIRCEISLPAPDFREGQFGTWLVRIILDSIPMTATTTQITDIGGGDIDFKIA